MADKYDEHYESDHGPHGPPGWTPLLFVLVFFVVLFFVIFPPKGPKVEFYQIPIREKADKISDIAEFVNREAKNPALTKKLAGLIEAIYSEGDMPPVEKDLREDSYKEDAAGDYNIVIDNEPAKKYLEKILNYLEKQAGEIWGNRATNLHLYDDRYVGLRNNVFSLPGETIFFGVSAIFAAENEAELAAVLSHERAHIVLRHNALRRKVTRNITFLEHKFAKSNDQDGQRILLLAKAKILGFLEIDGELHRTQELQADNIGQLILRKCGYDDLASAGFLPKLASLYLTDQIALENVKNRVASIKENSFGFKRVSGYEGKNFVVSTPEEFKATQDDLKKYLDKN